MTGLQLKLQRVAARVKGIELAQAMDVNPSVVTRVEQSALVTDRMARRYLKALETCRHVPDTDYPKEVA